MEAQRLGRSARQQNVLGRGAYRYGVSFLIVPNADSALSQYDAGELGFVDVYASAIRRVLRDDRYAKELIRVPRAQSTYLAMNQNLYAPFKDIRVRQAISLSIDRKGMIHGLYGGAAFMLNGVVTPGVPGFNSDLPEPQYDPARAKALMTEADFPDGKGLPPIEISSTEAYKDELTYYADQFHRVLGLPVTVKVVERASFIHAMNAGEVAFFPWGGRSTTRMRRLPVADVVQFQSLQPWPLEKCRL
jgi:oligopeptide transport system substrate-binding protein